MKKLLIGLLVLGAFGAHAQIPVKTKIVEISDCNEKSLNTIAMKSYYDLEITYEERFIDVEKDGVSSVSGYLRGVLHGDFVGSVARRVQTTYKYERIRFVNTDHKTAREKCEDAKAQIEYSANI